MNAAQIVKSVLKVFFLLKQKVSFLTSTSCRSLFLSSVLSSSISSSLVLIIFSENILAAATAQTRPSNGVPVAGLGGYQVGERPIVLRQLLLW